MCRSKGNLGLIFENSERRDEHLLPKVKALRRTRDASYPYKLWPCPNPSGIHLKGCAEAIRV